MQRCLDTRLHTCFLSAHQPTLSNLDSTESSSSSLSSARDLDCFADNMQDNAAISSSQVTAVQVCAHLSHPLFVCVCMGLLPRCRAPPKKLETQNTTFPRSCPSGAKRRAADSARRTSPLLAQFFPHTTNFLLCRAQR